MIARVGFLDHDCLPPHDESTAVPGSTAWFLAAIVVVAVLWTILE